jgi:hypothetical protein
MKAYGHSRRDKLECKYGCCTTKSGVKKNCRVLVDRARRKAARRVAIESDTE